MMATFTRTSFPPDQLLASLTLRTNNQLCSIATSTIPASLSLPARRQSIKRPRYFLRTNNTSTAVPPSPSPSTSTPASVSSTNRAGSSSQPSLASRPASISSMSASNRFETHHYHNNHPHQEHPSAIDSSRLRLARQSESILSTTILPSSSNNHKSNYISNPILIPSSSTRTPRRSNHCDPFYEELTGQKSNNLMMMSIRNLFTNSNRIKKQDEDDEFLLKEKQVDQFGTERLNQQKNPSLTTDQSTLTKGLNQKNDQKQQQAILGLFGRLRQLTKLYGSAALVVYGILGALDFGLSFLTIYLVGTEHVRRVEDWILEELNWKRVHGGATGMGNSGNTTKSSNSHSVGSTNGLNPEASETHIDSNILWTTAVVAYTIHKTILLPVRIGLTAWITPPIVRNLRKRGWKIGRNLE